MILVHVVHWHMGLAMDADSCLELEHVETRLQSEERTCGLTQTESLMPRKKKMSGTRTSRYSIGYRLYPPALRLSLPVADRVFT